MISLTIFNAVRNASATGRPAPPANDKGRDVQPDRKRA